MGPNQIMGEGAPGGKGRCHRAQPLKKIKGTFPEDRGGRSTKDKGERVGTFQVTENQWFPVKNARPSTMNEKKKNFSRGLPWGTEGEKEGGGG